MGYAGGTKADPTYHYLGDHMESIQIDFDPKVISYRRLLEIFWQSHNPFAPSHSRQYASAVLYADEAQKRLALETKALLEAKRGGGGGRGGRGGKVRTEIAPLRRFYRAEDYHQKYRLRHSRELFAELAARYNDEKAFTDSTLAARLNAYLGGEGNPRLLKKELPLMGLSARSQERLREMILGRGPSQGGADACPAL